MDFNLPPLADFLSAQVRDHGAKTELDAGLWTLFAVPASAAADNTLACSLLSTATFTHDSGQTEDDQWTLYYVDTANRPAALDWLDDLVKSVAGEIRPIAAPHRALILELVSSPKPHRVAQDLADAHTRGELCAGAIFRADEVRSLLDRLHQREPLFFSAFRTLLNHHLIDMVVLHRQLLSEDIALKNEFVSGGLSRDPFLQTRQDATVEIRNTLLRFQLINPIDQQKNLGIKNPYAVYLEVVCADDLIIAPIDGVAVNIAREDFISALHTIRQNLNRGGQFSSFDTQAPWMNPRIAHPFRFIKQRVDSRPDLAVFDTLYMLERAVSA